MAVSEVPVLTAVCPGGRIFPASEAEGGAGEVRGRAFMRRELSERLFCDGPFSPLPGEKNDMIKNMIVNKCKQMHTKNAILYLQI